MKEDFEKMKIAIRYWLSGKNYYKAVEAMNFAEQYHNGKRKDGNHEFSHQVSQANLAKTLIHHLRFPEQTFILIFLHDIIEDKENVSYEMIEKKFGVKICEYVDTMTKEYRGTKYGNEPYYVDLAECPVASVAKGLDRIHNLMSMLNAFKPEKRVSYIQETLDYTIPMLKKARRNFPDQEGAYENIKFIITNQIQIYDVLNKKELEMSK